MEKTEELVKLLIEKEIWNKAKKYAQELLITHSGLGYMNLAIIYDRQSMRRKALQMINKAISATPDDWQCWMIKGNIYSAMGKLDQALNCYAVSKEKFGSNENSDINMILINEALAYSNHNKLNKSLFVLDNMKPDEYLFADVELIKARIYQKKGHPDISLKILKNLKNNKNCYLSIDDLSQVYAQIGYIKLRYDKNKHLASRYAWKSLRCNKRNPNALSLLRSSRAKTSKHAKFYSLWISNKKIVDEVEKEYLVCYGVIQKNVEDYLDDIIKLEGNNFLIDEDFTEKDLDGNKEFLGITQITADYFAEELEQ